MTVKLRKGILSIRLWLPDSLAFLIVKKAIKRVDGNNISIDFDHGQWKSIIKSLKAAKKIYRKLELFSVKTPEGVSIKLKL